MLFCRTRHPFWRVALVSVLSTSATFAAPNRAREDEAKPSQSLGSTSEVDAATRAQAREMAQQALELMHQERFSEAQALFAKAYQLVPAPTIALLEGRALEQMGRLVQAAERYRVATRTPVGSKTTPAAFQAAARDAARDLARVEVKIPHLTILIEGRVPRGSQARVDVDGQEIEASRLGSALPINPGDHVITLAVDGNVRVRDHVRVDEGESKKVTLGMAAEVAPARVQSDVPMESEGSSGKTAGWISLGIGAAATAFGVATGLMMLDAKRSLDAACDPVCPTDRSDALSRFRTTRVLSGVGFVAGGIGLGLGAAILLWPASSPEAHAAARIRPFAGANTLGLEGQF
jgi:hypothetical protein